MRKSFLIKIILISLITILIFTTKAYCAVDPSTTRIKIDNGDAWYNINISDSYAECEALNSTSSTLGTAALEAHLSTGYDWSIMALFSVSQYGATTANAFNEWTSTTGNSSGLYDMWSNYHTTSVLYDSTSTSSDFVSGLYEEDGVTLKKYVDKFNPTTGEEYDSNGNKTGKIDISYLILGGTGRWYNSALSVGTSKPEVVSIRNGIFGIYFGQGYVADNGGMSGRPTSTTTFRPVIWN